MKKALCAALILVFCPAGSHRGLGCRRTPRGRSRRHPGPSRRRAAIPRAPDRLDRQPLGAGRQLARPFEPFEGKPKTRTTSGHTEQFAFLRQIPRSRHEFILAVHDEYLKLKTSDLNRAALTNVHYTGIAPVRRNRRLRTAQAGAFRTWREQRLPGRDTTFIEQGRCVLPWLAQSLHCRRRTAAALNGCITMDGWVTTEGIHAQRRDPLAVREHVRGSDCARRKGYSGARAVHQTDHRRSVHRGPRTREPRAHAVRTGIRAREAEGPRRQDEPRRTSIGLRLQLATPPRCCAIWSTRHG